MSRLGIIAVLILGVASPCVGYSQTAGNPPLDEQVSVRAGAFLIDADVDQRRYGWPRISDGPPLDGGRLGIEETDVSPWLDARWRFADRWQAWLGYSDFSGEGRRPGALLPVGRPDSRLDMGLYSATVGYSLLDNPRADMGLGIGVDLADLEWGLNGRLLGGRRASDGLVPMPHLKLVAEYALNPKLTLGLSGGWLHVDYDRYDGRLLSATARLEYRAQRSLGLGLGYRLLSVDLDIDDQDRNGGERYSLGLAGPLFYLSSGF